MPYTYKKQGDQYCVYKKDTGKKVGCTDGTKEALNKYMAALHINAENMKNELKLNSAGVKDILKAILNKPEVIVKLGFRKFKDVIEYLKNAEIEEQDELEQQLKDLGVNVVYESKKHQLRKAIREEVRRALKAKK
jgi:hypothetical protein